MQCPLCKTEMVSIANRMVVEGDNSPDTATKLYSEHDMSCRNKNCANNGKVVETVKNEINLG